MFAKARELLAQWIAPEKSPPAKTGQRIYGGAVVDRLSADWAALNTSADSEILTSLRVLRARSRQLCRDNDYAKNAIRIIKNNVIGTGIGMQAQVQTSAGKMIARINDQIEDALEEWSDANYCDVSGQLCFSDMERMLMGAIAESGEVLVRKIKRPFGGGDIPFALEIIESDQLLDQWASAEYNGNQIRMGVEVDQWKRPAAYWMYPTHPGDYQFRTFVPSKFLRVPAEEIIHLYVADRPLQTRGVPWFHTALTRLRGMGGYEEAEIVAARASASIVGFKTSPAEQMGDAVDGGQRVEDMEPGKIKTLLPGEEFHGFNPSRPNSGMDAFLRLMLRGSCAGIGVPYAPLSGDWSQANYSSMRAASIHDRDNWRALQWWFIRKFRNCIHREWLDAAYMAGRINVPDFYQNKRKYQSVRFKPRGWSWVDPTKEVEAYKTAVRCGFMTEGDVIAQTAEGLDAEDVFTARRQELDLMAELGLVFDTDPSQVDDKGKVQGGAPLEEQDGNKPAEDPNAISDTPSDSTDDNSN